ncbi:unnamed protein product [Mytilus edulis]|uniref:DUF7042 domain-containing protein n=1 Tax=Mytilus edulis TaxID=6550 RepID=A0A8S3TLW0_MYTED|nr:unnamed protein product [Mytilus edulis]
MLVRDVRLFYGLFLLLRQSCGLCTYPSDLRGTWHDSVYGTIAFTDSSMNMETKSFVSGFTNTNFTCQLNNGDMYVSKSVESVTLGILGGFTINVWICFEIKSLTTSSFYYYLRSSDQDNLNFGDVVPVATTVTSVAEADVCNTSPGVGEFHMLVNPASAKEGLSAVPVPLLGDFTYTMNFGTASSECGVSAFWEGCSNTTIITLNNTACGSQFVGYSASGSLGCITSFQDTTSTSVYYVGVYNFDTSVNGASTKRFTCFTVEFDTNITMVSQSPNKCSSGSSPTVLPTDGALLQLTTVTSCAPVTPPDDPLSIAAIFAIVFSLISKTLPRGAHTVFTLSDTNTMVNKEIITEPKLVVKPIRNGQPQSMELQQWKNNAEFQEPEGQLKLVTKPQPL